LCNDCNSAIGYAKESPERLLAMAEYLRSFGVKNHEIKDEQTVLPFTFVA
jgi:hypothetical protein